MAFSDFMSLVQTLVVIFGGYIAWRGVDAWRHEMIGRRRADLADETLAMFYEAETLIGRVRFPGSSQSEGKTRPLSEGETEESRARYLDALYVPVERLEGDAAFWGRFDAARFRIRANFGNPAAAPFETFRDIRITIMVSAHSLIRDSRRERGQQPTQEDLARIARCESAIGWGDPDHDEIKGRVAGAIVQIETLCRPAIDGFNRAQRAWWKWPAR